MLIGLMVIGGLVVLLVLWAIGIYNGLVRLRNQVKNAWSQIDVQLKRRHDLIPNLVETVKGYMQHERQTLEASPRPAARRWGKGVGERPRRKGSCRRL